MAKIAYLLKLLLVAAALALGAGAPAFAVTPDDECPGAQFCDPDSNDEGPGGFDEDEPADDEEDVGPDGVGGDF